MAEPEISASLVTVGKPVDGGCAWTNFNDEVTFPTGATDKMSTMTGWESCGEVSTNGFTESRSVSATDLKGWHNTTLITSIDDETNTFKVEFVEVNRATAAKLRYGADAVTVDADGNVTNIAQKPYDGVARPLVFDELESNGWLRRTVFKKAVISSFDDVPHQRGSLMVYGMTFTVNDPGDGSSPIEIFRAKPSAPKA